MPHYWIILRIFLLSGAAGLIYEVVWARQLVLVFGNTTQAISAILTGFFGGMALGAAVGGRLADRSRAPLRLYGLAEVLLVVIVLLTPLSFRLLHEVYRGLYDTLQTMPTALALLRFALALLALGPATVLMGATLPILSRHLVRQQQDLSLQFGRLYTANTIGAVLGTELAGLVLIELLGLTGALVVGAACSGTAGLLALALDARERRAIFTGAAKVATAGGTAAAGGGAPAILAAAAPAEPVVPTRDPWVRLALAIAFLSGLTSLGYQVLWTRLISSGSGSTTYVFTTILAIFLIGIAIGAAVFTARFAHVRAPVAWVGASQLVVAALALAGLVSLGDVWGELPLVLKALLVVFPTTLVMGVAFPLASHLLDAREGHVGSSTGLLLAANTLGAIIGTFVVPFVLIPLIGSPRSVVALALLNALLGSALLAHEWAALPRWRPALGGLAAALVATAVLALAVPTGLVRDPGETRVARLGTLFESAEDAIASVQAGSVDADPHLWVAGTSMTSLSVDTKLMAVLPLALRPAARSILVIAFGMGASHRAALVAGYDVDTIELVPSVPRMFKYYFADADAVLANPRGRLIIADGRNYAELTDRRYDVIVVDPPPPVESSGTTLLYSREFYAACAARLTRDGVMLQWMPYHLMSVDDLREHVRTFADVFPEVTLVLGNRLGLYLFGATAPLDFEAGALRAALARPGVLADLGASPDAPATTLEGWEQVIRDSVWLAGPQVRRFAGSGPLITDDRPLPEYFLLRRALEPPSPAITRATLQALDVR